MIEFEKTAFSAEFLDAGGEPLQRMQEVRTDPVSLRQCRIIPVRALEKDRGTEKLYRPPEPDLDVSRCPFCPGNLESKTPCLSEKICSEKRMRKKRSILFPNLFPYTEWSAVSLFDENHYVEIGSAEPDSYRDCLMNCSEYLTRVQQVDPEAAFMSITQNHLPGAGGSLVHPHLQVHATKKLSNNHGILLQRVQDYRKLHGRCILSDLVQAEQRAGMRYIGSTGAWEWSAAFAPSGFYEIWGIAVSESSLLIPGKQDVWQGLAEGILSVQRFYKSLNRNAYNLSLLSIEDGLQGCCLRVSMTVRSSYAPWVRSDFTGFEIASGEMATFTYPEKVADMARMFWN